MTYPTFFTCTKCQVEGVHDLGGSTCKRCTYDYFISMGVFHKEHALLNLVYNSSAMALGYVVRYSSGSKLVSENIVFDELLSVGLDNIQAMVLMGQANLYRSKCSTR